MSESKKLSPDEVLRRMLATPPQPHDDQKPVLHRDFPWSGKPKPKVNLEKWLEKKNASPRQAPARKPGTRKRSGKAAKRSARK
jgi:hypothetical protein